MSFTFIILFYYSNIWFCGYFCFTSLFLFIKFYKCNNISVYYYIIICVLIFFSQSIFYYSIISCCGLSLLISVLTLLNKNFKNFLISTFWLIFFTSSLYFSDNTYFTWDFFLHICYCTRTFLYLLLIITLMSNNFFYYISKILIQNKNLCVVFVLIFFLLLDKSLTNNNSIVYCMPVDSNDTSTPGSTITKRWTAPGRINTTRVPSLNDLISQNALIKLERAPLSIVRNNLATTSSLSNSQRTGNRIFFERTSFGLDVQTLEQSLLSHSKRYSRE